jgi:hypothetical protein
MNSPAISELIAKITQVANTLGAKPKIYHNSYVTASGKTGFTIRASDVMTYKYPHRRLLCELIRLRHIQRSRSIIAPFDSEIAAYYAELVKNKRVSKARYYNTVIKPRRRDITPEMRQHIQDRAKQLFEYYNNMMIYPQMSYRLSIVSGKYTPNYARIYEYKDPIKKIEEEIARMKRVAQSLQK